VDPRKFFIELEWRKVQRAGMIHAMPDWWLRQIPLRVLLFFEPPNRVGQRVMMRNRGAVRPVESLI
jgi:hypothetical protein